MRITTFTDGTECRLAKVHGDSFEAYDGETFLFEFPDGSLKEGSVGAEGAEPFLDRLPAFDGVYDRTSRIVSLEA